MQRVKPTAVLRPSLLLRRLLSTPSTAPQPPEPIPVPKTPTQESVLYVLKKLGKNPPKALEFFDHLAANLSGFAPGPAAYDLVVRTLAGSRDHAADFWRLLGSMRAAGHSLDPATYHTLLAKFKHQKMSSEASALARFYSRQAKQSSEEDAVQSASKIIQESPSAASFDDNNDEDLSKKLEETNLPASEISVAKVVREVRSSPLKALGFFRWVASQNPDYKHGSVSYNAMVRVVGRDDSVKEFWDLIEEMKLEGIDMDVDTYIKILRQFLKGRMIEDAVKLYEFMMDGPYKPAIQDCGMLLRQISLTENPDLNLVWRVVSKYEAGGYSLSKSVYDGIHRSLARNGEFDKAEDIMRKMREAGYEPDNITYSQLVYGLCRSKMLEEACKVLDEMEEKGCVPDLKTWTVLIQGHCNAGEVDKALECLTKMIQRGCETDGDILDIFMKGFCDQRRVGSAYKLFIEMVETARVKPWQATCKYLIEELLGQRKLDEAMKVLRLMKNHKYPPFADPFSPYISKFGTVEDARELLATLSVKAYPSPAAYIHIFESFFSEGRYSEAQDLLFKCPHHIRKDVEISKLFGSIKA